MQSGARVALGIGAGYVLGRTRKMRLALMAAAAASGAVRGKSGGLLQRGMSRLGSTTDLDPVSRGMDLIKSAALTAAGSQLDSLTERLRGTAPGSRDDEDLDERDDRLEDEPEDEYEDETGEEDEVPEEDEEAEEDEAVDEEDEAEEDEAEEDEEDEDEEEAVVEEPAPKRSAARRTSAGTARRSAKADASPVRRTRR